MIQGCGMAGGKKGEARECSLCSKEETKPNLVVKT